MSYRGRVKRTDTTAAARTGAGICQNMKTLARLITAAALALVPLTAAAPAHANAAHCTAYLRSLHYVVGEGVRAACQIAEEPAFGPNRGGLCRDKLVALDVNVQHAITACREGIG